MPFDTQHPATEISPSPSDLSKAIDTYYQQVQEIGETIKAAKSELAGIQQQIDDAKAQRQLVYQTQRIEPLEAQITELTAKLTNVQAEHDQWVIKADSAKQTFNSVNLDFSQKQRNLEASWNDFHKQVDQLIKDQRDVKEMQNIISQDTLALAASKTAFENSRVSQQAAIDQRMAAASEAADKAQELLEEASAKMAAAVAAAQDAEAKQVDVANKLAAAQPILAQADAVAAQKQQNDTDIKTNSANALQNQKDAIEIRVAKVALNNQQQAIAAREQIVSQAEQKIGG